MLGDIEGGKTLRQRNEASCFPALQDSQTMPALKQHSDLMLFKEYKGGEQSLGA